MVGPDHHTDQYRPCTVTLLTRCRLQGHLNCLKDLFTLADHWQTGEGLQNSLCRLRNNFKQTFHRPNTGLSIHPIFEVAAIKLHPINQ